MQAENIMRYKVEENGELLPDFIVEDLVEGSGKHIACYITLENCTNNINLLINNKDNVWMGSSEKIEFVLEKHGVIKSIKTNDMGISGFIIVELGYKKTNI